MQAIFVKKLGGSLATLKKREGQDLRLCSHTMKIYVSKSENVYSAELLALLP